jgi:hypothetical protein
MSEETTKYVLFLLLSSAVFPSNSDKPLEEEQEKNLERCKFIDPDEE